MRSDEESWHISRVSYDIYGRLFHEIVIGQVTCLPEIEPFTENGTPGDFRREKLRAEQQQFLQTMSLMEELEGDEPPALDLRVGKPADSGTTPDLSIAIVGRVTSRYSEEAKDYAERLRSRLFTAFPRSYGLAIPRPNDAVFLNTTLPSLEDLQQASIWELVKETHYVPKGVGRGYTAIVGTYCDLLDSMIASWDALARSPGRVLLSVRCVPLPISETEALRNMAYWHLQRAGGSFGESLDFQLMEEARLRFDHLISSMHLLKLRIQIVSWNSEPVEVKAAIKASLTTTSDLRQRSCACSWLPCNEGNDRERAQDELTHVYARKQDPIAALPVVSTVRPLQSASFEEPFNVPDYDVVDIREASAVWRLPLARRNEIDGIEFKREQPFPHRLLAVDGDAISLGRILSGVGEREVQQFKIDDLARHLLILGESGGGKTTTTKSIVLQLWQKGIPSLIIDPVSSEYDELYALSSIFRENMRQGEDRSLCVFTPGAAGDVGMQLAFNPFCPQPGVSIDSHIITLKNCFACAFGLPETWSELVGRALRSLYQNFGWPASDAIKNREVLTKDDLERRPFPTIVDLIKAVEREIVKYENPFRDNTKAGLLGRLNDLAAGPLGALMQTRQRLDVARLVKRPVVIELRKLRASPTKSLIMLFLLTQLSQYYEGLRRTSKLQHMIVIEEAHRLLAPAPIMESPDNSANNSKAESVTIVVNMLSELRKYGVGLMLAEQLPTRLDRNVTKLTVTKILHRLSAQDDREKMASAMNMTVDQTKYAATLTQGQAALFTEGLVEPILLHMLNPWGTDASIAPAGRRPQPLSDEAQEALEREVEEHTTCVWPAPHHKDAPWNPCKWCRCECEPRTRLILAASAWWRQIKLNEVVNQAAHERAQAAREKRKINDDHLKTLADGLWEQARACSPKNAQRAEQKCGLTLACERYVSEVAKQYFERENAAIIVRNIERAIDLLLQKIKP